MNFLKYSLLRLAILVVVFLVCLYVGAGLILSGIAAVVAAFAICYLFFPRLHLAASEDFNSFMRRSPTPQNRVALEDEEAEDAYTDSESRHER